MNRLPVVQTCVQPVYADRWSESCLERAERMGEQVYLRTMARKVAWSPVKERFLPTEAECENITLDEAFNSLSESLRQVTWECRKFHANRDLVKDFEDCADHCSRFHTQQPKPQLPYRGNPFQKEESVQMTLPEGCYAITAHRPATGVRRTNIVQLAPQGCLGLHFNI
ncbi:hypothetical protein ACOMHN_046141 [Nucella lapillus]